MSKAHAQEDIKANILQGRQARSRLRNAFLGMCCIVSIVKCKIRGFLQAALPRDARCGLKHRSASRSAAPH
jgi:hypothetical protein